MKIKTLSALTLGALALALSSERPLPAGAVAASHVCAPQAKQAGRQPAPTWAVVRVTVTRDGTVEGDHIIYHSGNRAFDDAAIVAVANTGFRPSAHSPANSTTSFDYLLMSECGGLRSSRVMERLDPSAGIVKPGFSVAPTRDAWESSKIKDR
jgi:TonB family protein